MVKVKSYLDCKVLGHPFDGSLPRGYSRGSRQAVISCKFGFTIPELLVVVAVIVVMTLLLVPNWQKGQSLLSLTRATHQVARDIREAEELSQRAERFTCNTGIITGYGMYFTSNSSSYIIFAECNGDNVYIEGQDGVKEVISLEEGVIIKSVAPAGSIVFIPPTPVIHINPGEVTQTQITLQLANDASSEKTITITNKGVIEIH